MKFTTLSCCLLFSLVASFSQEAPKAAHADFSGRWRMEKEKSNFSSFKMPDIVVRVIEQRGVTMNVHTVQTTGDRTSTVDAIYLIDGTQSKNVINGRDAVSRTFWDGNALVINTDMKTSKNQDEQIQDRYELSDEGQTLTMISHVVTEKGEVTMTMVCAKEKVSG